ncbi:hypothetical protein ACF0H5_017621 [Mactra antiquata]
MSRIKHEILLLLCLLCGHIYAQNNLDISPEAFQILVTQVENLSKLAEHQNRVINELQDKFKFQENVNSELMDRLDQQERIIEDLSAKLVTHDKHQSSNSISTGPKTTSNNSTSRQSIDQQKDIKHLRQGIIRRRQNPSTAVAFLPRLRKLSKII